MSDTNFSVDTSNFLWEYTVDRGELESQLGRQVDADEWYTIKDSLDDAIAGLLSAL